MPDMNMSFAQVYIGGEFVGGCDIMIDMHKNGELIEELKKVGIKSDLDDWSSSCIKDWKYKQERKLI